MLPCSIGLRSCELFERSDGEFVGAEIFENWKNWWKRAMSRRLPVYLLIDSSGSMKGEPILSVNEGLRAMMSALRQDPYALETVHLSISTFDLEAKEILPLTPIEQAQVDDITTPESGPTHLGEGLELIIDCYKRDVRKATGNEKGDFLPMLLIMTDGKPSDQQKFKEMVVKINKMRFSKIIGCAAGPKAKSEDLTSFADPVIALEMTDSSTFSAFFKWVSDSITAGSHSGGLAAAGGNELPPAPAEVKVVI